MFKIILRSIAIVVIAAGLFLLIRLLFSAASGNLAAMYFAEPQGSWMRNVFALGLGLPVPLHVISVGFFLQLRWLSPFWAKLARIAVVVSGCLLGVVLGIRVLVL